jgi:hypothetical protein
MGFTELGDPFVRSCLILFDLISHYKSYSSVVTGWTSTGQV